MPRWTRDGIEVRHLAHIGQKVLGLIGEFGTVKLVNGVSYRGRIYPKEGVYDPTNQRYAHSLVVRDPKGYDVVADYLDVADVMPN